MLQITIDLVPAGFEPLRRTIATMRVSNEDTQGNVCDYRVVATEAASALTGDPAGIAECLVVGHDRRQRVWALLEAVAAELQRADWVPL
jgi:hypothetical protein